MKTIASFLGLLLVTSAHAVNIPIAWDAPPGTTVDTTNVVVLGGVTNTVTRYADVSGYWVYHATNITNFTRMMALPSTAVSVTISNMPDVNHFFFLVATNFLTGLPSVPSNIIETPSGPSTSNIIATPVSSKATGLKIPSP